MKKRHSAGYFYEITAEAVEHGKVTAELLILRREKADLIAALQGTVQAIDVMVKAYMEQRDYHMNRHEAVIVQENYDNAKAAIARLDP